MARLRCRLCSTPGALGFIQRVSELDDPDTGEFYVCEDCARLIAEAHALTPPAAPEPGR